MLILNIKESDETMFVEIVDVHRSELTEGKLMLDIIIPSDSTLSPQGMSEQIYLEVTEFLDDLADELRRD